MKRFYNKQLKFFFYTQINTFCKFWKISKYYSGEYSLVLMFSYLKKYTSIQYYEYIIALNDRYYIYSIKLLKF